MAARDATAIERNIMMDRGRRVTIMVQQKNYKEWLTSSSASEDLDIATLTVFATTFCEEVGFILSSCQLLFC